MALKRKGILDEDRQPGTRVLRDLSSLPLAEQHRSRPIYIDPESRRVLLETFSPDASRAEQFLVMIAEPQSRVMHIHEYLLTVHSLFAAVSMGLKAHDICSGLASMSKTALPKSLVDFVEDSTRSFGKVRLVLKHTRYFIESSDPDALHQLLSDGEISECRVAGATDLEKEAAPSMSGLVIPGTKLAAGARENPDQPQRDNQLQTNEILNKLTEDDEEEEEVDQVHSFEIRQETVQIVQRRCREINLPLTEEYDFRNDDQNATLDIDIKPMIDLRPYQETALNKMFANGRGKSGIIVLPCGAGKTLVGVAASCTIKKGVIVLCTSTMSASQWRMEYLKWSNINPSDLAVFTSDNKTMFSGNTGVVISTYSMVTQSGARSYDAQKLMDFITSREWGLMVLDEVHVVPADMFKKVTYTVKAHCKLGLTATLLREDDKISHLNFIIGPKLYEANWQQLSQDGWIARVQCAEVWCQMTTEFYSEYLRAKWPNQQSLLFTMNPKKFQACQFLIDYHEKRGDKIIVFSDNVYALQRYARKLGKAYIYGGTGNQERLQILDNFQHNPDVNTIFLSKIGDTSLDLPEATCLIQISSHYGSRRQEAQRLGRILRAKRRNDEGFNAFFYSLVSKDTAEMYFSSKRQAFLVDQGYAFKVITHLHGMDQLPGLAFTSPQERRELLTDVMLQSETAGDVEKIDDDLFSARSGGSLGGRRAGARGGAGVRRTAGTLADLSGGQDMAYVEFNRTRNKDLKQKGPANSFIKKLKRDAAKRKQANK
ncbi:DNA repair helicase RAD25 [Lineolata rhizophorae]|uniref:DNA 3'-5' helicase n=1 Tax=Lineolata rhizophorae TaxID=578093 RepID=A0A6A6NV38_9PEZI|nr:DNA repair helicase RAD25 [Lineolata rhizophorae]